MPCYEPQTFHIVDAHLAIARLADAGENPGDHVIGAESWDHVADLIDDDSMASVSVDSLSEYPVRIMFRAPDDIVADGLGWITLEPIDACPID